MKKLLIILGLLTTPSYSQEFRLLDLDYLGLEYITHVNYRDSYFLEYETLDRQCVKSTECFKYGANALFDITLVQLPYQLQQVPFSLFWRNDVKMDATNKQVRQVGWLWEIGIPIGKHVELFHRHHSRHVLENTNSQFGFPLRDEYVVKLNIYKRSKE